MMSILAELQPRRKHRVIDLVREAGIDVSDWANFKRGPRWAGANPKYCYEWAFAEAGKVVVLNLWYPEMEERDGVVTRIGNFRQDADRNRTMGRGDWARRAARVDRALGLAQAQGVPIRVVINAGVPRRKGDPNAVASQVTHRELDPVDWRLSQYDEATGAFVLTRGPFQPTFVDQWSIEEAVDPAALTRDRHGREFLRDRAVRAAALARAAGRCEYCQAPGFAAPDGSIYLETHHVTSLSDGGADTTGNVIALCPNHHRQAHYGEARLELRAAFQSIVEAHGRRR